MAEKYHIGKDGTSKICTAKGECKLGGPHFDNKADADKEADRQNEIKAQIEELKAEQSNPESTLKPFQIRRRIMNLEKELADPGLREREEEAERIRQQAIEEKANKEKADMDKFNNLEKIELSDNFKFVYTTNKYDINKIHGKAVRGEVSEEDKDQRGGNGGLAIYGVGTYSTLDKKYASKFGNVRVVEREELPEKPLELTSENNFNLVLQDISDKYGISRDTLKEMNPNLIVKKMGYDGLVMGKGTNRMIVKFY